MSARRRLSSLLLALYPELWRERYGEEMRALLDDDPPDPRAIASLLWGAADAHLRPQRSWRAGAPAVAAMRLSVGALFACWMLTSVAGSAFAKLTEHMDGVEHAHPALVVARDMITIGALLGAAAVAIGGLPLVWQALRTAIRRRDGRLALALASPALAGALLVAFAVALAAIAPSRHGRFPAAFVLELLVPVSLAALTCALVGALAPKAVMRRAHPPAVMLRLASWGGQALTAAIALVAGGLLLYVAALFGVAGAGTDASGPLGLTTRVTLCFTLLAALPALAMALPACSRARSAALARG